MPSLVTFDDIVRHLRAEKWDMAIGSTNTIALKVRGVHGVYPVFVRYPWEREIIVITAELPEASPPECRAVALELAARINWGLIFATCEINPDTGHVRFRGTMPVDDAPFHAAQFGTVLATVCSLADRYADAFRNIAEHGMTAADALRAAENSGRT